MIGKLLNKMAYGAGRTTSGIAYGAGRMKAGYNTTVSAKNAVSGASVEKLQQAHAFYSSGGIGETGKRLGNWASALPGRAATGAKNMGTRFAGAVERHATNAAEWARAGTSRIKADLRANYAAGVYKGKVQLDASGRVSQTPGVQTPHHGYIPPRDTDINAEFLAAGGRRDAFVPPPAKPKSSTNTPVDAPAPAAPAATPPPSSTNTPAAPPPPSPTPSSTNTPIGDPEGLFGGFSGVTQGGLGSLVGGSVLGGITSYATGGEFGQGMAMGGMGAFGIRNLHRGLGANAGHLQKKASNFVGGTAGEGSFLQNRVHQMQNTASFNTLSQRKSMYMGAGLMGIIGGGNRESKRRGFNSHRGNTF